MRHFYFYYTYYFSLFCHFSLFCVIFMIFIYNFTYFFTSKNNPFLRAKLAYSLFSFHVVRNVCLNHRKSRCFWAIELTPETTRAWPKTQLVSETMRACQKTGRHPPPQFCPKNTHINGNTLGQTKFLFFHFLFLIVLIWTILSDFGRLFEADLSN